MLLAALLRKDHLAYCTHRWHMQTATDLQPDRRIVDWVRLEIGNDPPQPARAQGVERPEVSTRDREQRVSLTNFDHAGVAEVAKPIGLSTRQPLAPGVVDNDGREAVPG